MKWLENETFHTWFFFLELSAKEKWTITVRESIDPCGCGKAYVMYLYEMQMFHTYGNLKRLRERTSKIAVTKFGLSGWNDLICSGLNWKSSNILSIVFAIRYVLNVFDFRFCQKFNWKPNDAFAARLKPNTDEEKSTELDFFSRTHISNCLLWKFSLFTVKCLNESKYLDGENPSEHTKTHNVVRSRMHENLSYIFITNGWFFRNSWKRIEFEFMFSNCYI